MRRFEFCEGLSNKFWEIEQAGSELHVSWGKIGTAGQKQTKSHADEGKASAAMDKLVREKTGKGYVETAGAAVALPPLPAAAPAATAPAAAPAATLAAMPAPVPAAGPATAVAAAAPAPATDATLAPWLAAGALIDMPAALAQQAMASRRFPGPPPKDDAGASWATFVTFARKFGPLNVTESDPLHQAAVSEAAARVAENQMSGSRASDVVLLALETVFCERLPASTGGSTFIDFLVSSQGLPYALDVLIDMEHLSIIQYGYPATWCIQQEANRHFSRHDTCFCATELALRKHLAHAGQALWQACASTIAAALPGIHPRRQALFGVLLPDLPALSNELALQLAAAGEDSAAWLALSADHADSLAALAPFKPNTGQYYQKYFFTSEAAVATMIQEHGIEAVARLRDGAPLDATALGLRCIGTPQAITVLAQACDTGKHALKHLPPAAARWPLAAIAALGELVARDGRGPTSARQVLTTLIVAHPQSLPALTPWLSAPAAKLIDAIAGLLGATLPSADDADLPSVLADPPWRRPAPENAAVLALAPLPLAPRLHWSEPQRQALLTEIRRLVYVHTPSQQDPRALAAQAIAAGDAAGVLAVWRACHGAGHQIADDARTIADLPAPLNAALWTALAQHEMNSPGYALATLGLQALGGLVVMCERRPGKELPYAMYFAAVELAPVMAATFATSKDKVLRKLACDWLLAYPEHAAGGLIAPALGAPGKAREHARKSLRMLAASKQADHVMAVAARYDQTVSAALRAMLDEDPLNQFPLTIAPLPAFWQPRAWARPVLALNGKAIPDHALDHIGAMLRFPRDELLYPGIAQLQQACTPASLANFGWDLFCAWLESGSDVKENWAFTSLGLLGNDDTARKLTPLIRAWPGESQHLRAVGGLEILALIGSDTALMLLNGIAQKVKFKGLQERAREKIDQIAEARSLTAEELADRLAPDLGLDQQGALLLDFGPRQFLVGFDEALKPNVRDSAGARLSDLPKPKKTDDAALAAQAVERFKLLKKDARTIAAQQVQRLEVAMCAQRRWDPQVFFTFLAGHPLVRHLVQRLVWGVYQLDVNDGDGAGAGNGAGVGAAHGGRLLGCFRVGADGEPGNGDDEPFAMPQGAAIRIGIPHALELPAAQAAAFGQLFTDYELLQPFPQLGRDIHVLTAQELAADQLLRWQGVKVKTGAVLGLVNRGWRRGEVQDAGCIWYFSKPLGAERQIELRLDPGLIVGMVDEYPDQTLGAVITGSIGRWGDIQQPSALSSLDPIAASELVRDLEALRS